jgi:pyruvate,water dikinase
VIDRRDDVFLLTGDELRELRSHATADWRQRVEGRRAERSRYAAMRAPDALYPGASPDEERPAGEPALRGMAVSAGYAEGPVRLIHGPDDLSRVRRGDILVTPVIDPGHAAVFSLAAGVIVEMGGTLSHGAIIAREYGIPAVANVPGAMEQLGDGDWVSVDAGTGFIRRTAPAPPH